jgi:UDP-N-acetylglucosamine--N-acetylmuramyl-(pentapeptide) pyrophosphoryl-undecaprenol N-acetylglucosamine transferase
MCLNIGFHANWHDTLYVMRIGLVGGGTGGHFYPLIAVAEELITSEHAPELYYFGPSPYDADELSRHGITYVSCPAGKLRRYFSLQNFVDAFKSVAGLFVAIWKLYVIYPDVIFSKGGYTSVPILMAARFLMIPVVIHESDAVPGIANKMVTKQAKYIGIAYDDVATFFPPEKTALVGIPTRKQFEQIPSDPFAFLGIPNDKPLIYVTGGSQGAERLNTLMFKSLQELLPHYRIFHQLGEKNLDEYIVMVKSLLKDSPLLQNYYLQSMVSAEMVVALMAASSVIITRAGSTTLFEIAKVGRPSIVIPIPEDISRDQRTNAYAYARSGAAVVIEEHNLSPNLLIQEINAIILDQKKQYDMATAARGFYLDGASQKLANVLLSIGIEHGS